MTRTLVLIGLLSSALMSCEEPFELEGQIASQLVIESQLASGRSPSVRISAIDELGNSLPTNELAQGFVSLTIKDGRTFVLQDVNIDEVGVTFGTTDEEVIVSGLTYSLNVDAPGYAPVKSTTTVPRSAGFSFNGIDGSLPIKTSPSDEQVVVPFNLSDNSTGKNFFHVLVRVFEGFPVNSELNSFTNLVPFSFKQLQSDAFGLGSNGAFFCDRTFNNRTLSNDILIERTLVESYVNPTINIEVRTVSESYFNFFKRRTNSSGGKFPEIISPISSDNISNGTGVFGSYSTQNTSISVSF